jgi:trimeric autotransporter adhesin
MKKILLVVLIQLTFVAVQAQTHYGTSAGTLGSGHSYFGSFAGNAATGSSFENSFFGGSAGRQTTTGDGNTAIGFSSLRQNTEGYWNTAVGASSLRLNTTGHSNVAIGRVALYWNTSGIENIAVGTGALLSNTGGSRNTATGARSLYENTNGYENVATGFEALYSNTTGTGNIAIGYLALYSNIDGSGNTATGSQSLRVSKGRNNTATGNYAMGSVYEGQQNAAFGNFALNRRNGSYNSAFGALSLGDSDGIGSCIGSFNSAFGYRSGPVSWDPCDITNTTALGANATVTASNQIRIGDANVTSIGGQVSWTTLSDGRFKREIKKDVAGLDFINQLNPVSYTLDKKAVNTFLRIPDSLNIDNEATRKAPIRQIGFVAQEVEAVIKKSGYVFSGIEAPQNENDPYTIRYAEFVVPLVKAVQELTAKGDEQQKRIEVLTEALRQYGVNTLSDENRPAGAMLFQNNPNPFSSTTEISMELPEDTQHASIIVYNLEGKQLKDIQVNERGRAAVKISGSEFNPGMYLYALIADGKVVDTKRLILTK